MYFIKIKGHPRLKKWTLTIGNDSYTLDSFDMQYLSKLLKEAGF